MAIIAVGSLAFDSITTFEGTKDRILGGSLTHFANAANFLSKPLLIGVVGNDFESSHWDFIKSKSGSTEGIKILKDEKCFFWEGVYSDDFERRDTLKTELNAFAKFDPAVPDSYKKRPFILFLANIDPVIQKKVALEAGESRLSILDTMNFWIENSRKDLDSVLDTVDGIVINEDEALLMTGEKNIVKAARSMFRPGFKLIIVKKGANGVMVFGPDFIITLPAYPIPEIKDPTGAGDSFAGAFMSYIDHFGIRDMTREKIKSAAAYATVIASFAVEDFGVQGLSGITQKDIKVRMKDFMKMAAFK